MKKVNDEWERGVVVDYGLWSMECEIAREREESRTPWVKERQTPPLHDDIPPPLPHPRPSPPASPFSTSVALFCACECVMKGTGSTVARIIWIKRSITAQVYNST